MPRVASPPLGVWSVAANAARFAAVEPTLASVVDAISPITQHFRRDLLAFYKATGLVPHPQLLPFHPDEEDPTTNGELLVGTTATPGVVFDLAEVDTLVVKNWQLDDGSFAGLCFALRHCPTIHTVIFFNAQLGSDHVESLCRLIPQTRVTRFHVEWNAPPPDSPPLSPSVFSDLLAPTSPVSTLSLRACGLTADHATAIAAALRTNATLELLNLFANAIGDDGALEIAYALPFNAALKSLSLGDAQLSGKAAKVLVDVLAPKYVAPPALLKLLEDAEPRIQSELDQAKKAKKKLDRLGAIQHLGLPVLETVESVQYAAGNATLQDLVLSGNAAIDEGAVVEINSVLETHHAHMGAFVRRVKLQRIASLRPLASGGPPTLSPLLQF